MEKRSFSLPLHCNYLVQRPEKVTAETLLVVLVHGHAMTPEEMLRLSAPLVGEEHILAAPQGPYQLWRDNHGKDRSVAFHWSTSHEPEHSRRLHHEMILRVMEDLQMPASRTVLLSFSQSVSLAYRFICTHPQAVRGAIGICGGLPGDWETSTAYQRPETAVLHITTLEDQWYPPSVTEQYTARLRQRIADVEFHMLRGGHRIPSSSRSIVRAWLTRVFGAA